MGTSSQANGPAPGSGPRIAVVGGGITGAFAAFFLARSGARAVIIERDEIGAHASGHNAGGLNPLHGPGIPGPMLELALASLRLHLDSWEQIGRLGDVDFSGRFEPRIHIAFTEAEAAGLADTEPLYQAAPGFSARWLDRVELRRRVPEVSPAALGGLWTAGNPRVEPGAYTRAVANAAVGLGTRIVAAQARGTRSNNGRVTGLVLDDEVLPCDGLVIAAGPWSAAMGEWLEVSVPVSPLKGDLVLVQTRRPLPAQITWAGVGAYPRSDGSVWLGGSEVAAGFDEEISVPARARILDGAAELLPGLDVVRELGQVTGLRPVTPDGLPIVGVLDGWQNVCVATGGGRKGMLFGAALGRAAAQLLLTGSTDQATGACDPARFTVLV